MLKVCGSVKVSPVILPLLHVWKQSLPVPGGAASPPNGCVTTRMTVVMVQTRSACLSVLQMSFNVAVLQGGFQFFYNLFFKRKHSKPFTPLSSEKITFIPSLCILKVIPHITPVLPCSTPQIFMFDKSFRSRLLWSGLFGPKRRQALYVWKDPLLGVKGENQKHSNRRKITGEPKVLQQRNKHCS